MASHEPPSLRPARILIATDLSPRCDRALDRAISLAEKWASDLVVLHVLEKFVGNSLQVGIVPSWRRPVDPVALARKHLLRDVGKLGSKATILVDEGDVSERILKTAEQMRCDLIVMGTARNELFGRFSLGGTVNTILRSPGVPILVVENRPRGSYRRIVAAADLSECSRKAIEFAANLFPNGKPFIFHAYDPPFHGLLADPTTARAEYGKVASREFDAFFATMDVPPTWRRANILIEYGSPSLLLRELVRDKEIDLLVLGTRGRGMIAEAFVGSVAKSIMENVPCDVLLVRPTATIPVL